MACKRVWSKTLILSIGMILQVEKWLGYRHQHKLGLGSAGHSIVFPLNENKSGFGWLLATRVVGTLKINLTQFFNPGRFPKVTNFWWSFEVVNNFWWIIRDWNYRERGNWDFFCFTRTTPPKKNNKSPPMNKIHECTLSFCLGKGMRIKMATCRTWQIFQG